MRASHRPSVLSNDSLVEEGVFLTVLRGCSENIELPENFPSSFSFLPQSRSRDLRVVHTEKQELEGHACLFLSVKKPSVRQTGGFMESKKKVTLLLVDDEKMNTMILSRRLQKEGYIIDEAADGQQALDHVLEKKAGPDFDGSDDADYGWLAGYQRNQREISRDEDYRGKCQG